MSPGCAPAAADGESEVQQGKVKGSRAPTDLMKRDFA